MGNVAVSENIHYVSMILFIIQRFLPIQGRFNPERLKDICQREAEKLWKAEEKFFRMLRLALMDKEQVTGFCLDLSRYFSLFDLLSISAYSESR